MGTASYILAANPDAADLTWGSAPHGAGRAMSRSQAKKRFKGRDVAETLHHHGIYLRGGSLKEVAEEAPGAYKDVDAVADCARRAGVARPVARLRPLVVVKG
jgi:tRNA-splicing ligase RtcB